MAINQVEYRQKFQALLRELFQFDSADLDFGIYRILNYKRDVIERFIEKDLLDTISKELESGALAERAGAARDLGALAAKVRADLGDAALDADGVLADAYHDTPLGRKYLQFFELASGAKPKPEVETTIFNHLYAFFSRYYDAGDFMSKRRYSKREKYAIPYNGEEVYLYWANKDQYYVKTAEHFTDYSFRAPGGVTVHFKLQAADVEKDNVKGDKRFFVPVVKDATFDAANTEVVIPFEYRPLNEQESIKFGTRNQQDSIIEEAAEGIPKHFASEAVAAAAVADVGPHLRRYTARNTSDYFIHKDLKGFLERELDFYLKNEVINVDELEAAGEARAEAWFQQLCVIKAVGRKVITFLAQVEDFQKMLFEKKKFILETQYCITVQNIPESFHAEIADNDAQWLEWQDLLHINEEEKNLFNANAKSKTERRVAFLKSHPTLVLDTKHFDADFRDRLLASYDDIDGITDGLLIHGENNQALNLLLEKYGGAIKCVHIDPPYNTQTSGFLYKNAYQHSSWLTMMDSRVAAGIRLLARDGAFLCHIDENEYEVLHQLFSDIGIPNGGTIVWDKKNPMLGRKGIATQHEYVLWRTWTESPVYLRPKNIRILLAKAESLIQRHGGVNDAVRREFASWISKCEGLTGGEKAYRFIDDNGRVFRSVAMGAPEPRTDPKFFIPLIHPFTKKACPIPSTGWSRTPETLQELMTKGEILFGKDETVQPTLQVFLTDDSKRQLSSVVSDGGRGKTDLIKLGLEFPYCHPVSLYEELLGAGASNDRDVVVDYFAGSGTSGHAVINLNRQEGGRRKFVLAEIDSCFDTILVPRIKKVTFTSEWKKGKPARMVTAEEAEHSPRIVKYSTLESYEDALNSIPPIDIPQTELKYGDYVLKYMLPWETKDSATFLNVAQLEDPFNYKLLVVENGVTVEKPVDLPETFIYLLGLHVTSRRVYDDDDRKYVVYHGASRDGRSVAVIWRATKGWTEVDYERDRAFVASNNLADGADDIYVNGNSAIPGAKSLDPIFKARMFAPLDSSNGGT